MTRAVVYNLYFRSGNVNRSLTIAETSPVVIAPMESFSASNHNAYDVQEEELAEVLREGLKDCFRSVKVNVVPCPDLTASPFGLLRPGLAGKSVVCDVGSMTYLLPVANTSKRYSFGQVIESSGVCGGQLLGAGGGPFFTHGKSCEMAASLQFANGKIASNSTLHGVYDEQTGTPQVINATDNNFGLVGQLLSSEGLPGSVVEVDVAGRLKEGSVYVFLREVLTAAYGKLDKPVALGGVFVLTDSKARFHVLPNFPPYPVDTPARRAEFIKIFEMDPPVLGMGTLVSHDPYGIDLKLEHFHCYNEAKTLAGHFYWDTDPEKAHYRLYLTVAKSLLRIDPKEKA
ncbi:Ester hydrolase [Echinococcus granulosus]|uniref:Ester hydrolase n=1 Tax=Echinococcus granulosus TaxID=6210 RepID=W6UK44_ECHGR|nr:Ester hydrolase [Echinococcus granulosus]EUB61511.1 Ester hydrolase [Echinococcus granulosus]